MKRIKTFRICPECGAELVGDGEDDRGIERFECSNKNCHEPVWFSYHGGKLMRPNEYTHFDFHTGTLKAGR